MDSSDELRRARRAAQPPPGAALLRLPAHQARALLPTATAPQDAAALEREGGIVGALLHAALRRFRELYSGGGRLALPQSILAQMLLYNALLHRARLVGSPPSADFLLRLLLRLPARHVARLLPPPAAHPGPSLVPFLLYAGLRRLRGRSLHGDEDDNALLVLLRVALGRVCAACVPRIIFAQGQGLRFALLHRARRVGPPPSGPYVLRLLLRLPAHEARRLLRRPTERTLRGPTLVRLLLYAGLRRLQATIQPGSDGLYRDEDDVDILEMILRVALPG